MVVDATLATGATQRYQLFIGGRPAHPWPEFLEGKDRELLAVLPDGEGNDVVFYDALIDPDLAIAVLHLVSPDSEVEVRRPIVLEHSNSSVVFDERTILKVLRKVEPGPNPDVEIPRVLADRGYEHVLPPIAELRRDDMDLAVLRDFLVGATEGWQLARASVRDVLASRLAARGERRRLRARRGAPRRRRSPSLHLAMAEAWGSEPGDAGRVGRRRWRGGLDEVAGRWPTRRPLDVDAVRARLDDARRARRRRRRDPHPRRPPPRPGDPGRRRLAGARLRGRAGPPPRRPLHPVVAAARRGRHAPLAPLRRRHRPGRVGPGRRGAASRCSTRGSSATATRSSPPTSRDEGIDALLPVDPAGRTALLAAFELDKAVYELGYELGHRPELVAIPLAGIDRLVAGAVPS